VSKKSVNICLVSTEYPPETAWGGIGTHVYELAHGLKNAGHTVVVIARAIDKASVHDDNGVSVYRVLPVGLIRWPVTWRIQQFWDGYNLAVALSLRQVARRHAIQIVEAPESRAEAFFGLVMPHRTFPIVVKLHTGTYWNWKFNGRALRTGDRLTAWMERVSIRRADLTISPSQALIDLNRSQGGYLANGQEAIVVRNPINTAQFRKLGQRPPLSGPYVMFAGRIEERKGVRALFKAMKHVWFEYPDLKLVLAGADSGLLQELMSSLPSACRNNVVHMGFMSRSEMPIYYRYAEACVFPSVWENFPYTCLEAMASNAVVVASKNGGMAEMIEDGTSGFLIAPEDDQMIAERIVRIMGARDLREQMAYDAGQKVRKSFDTSIVVENTLKVYEKVIAEYPRG
jgi:glycosyltransferase involved in cell wall biosynthesis